MAQQAKLCRHHMRTPTRGNTIIIRRIYVERVNKRASTPRTCTVLSRVALLKNGLTGVNRVNRDVLIPPTSTITVTSHFQACESSRIGARSWMIEALTKKGRFPRELSSLSLPHDLILMRHATPRLRLASHSVPSAIRER